MIRPRVLIYKRNHTGDPDSNGTFGCDDCMGKIRGYRYDAVIGIGVSRPWPEFEGIADRITWVGVGPRRVGTHKARAAPVIRFDRWHVSDAKGKDLRSFAPRLAEYFYSKHRRYFFSDGLSDEIQQDIERILKLAGPQKANVFREDPRRIVECRLRCPPKKGTQARSSVLRRAPFLRARHIGARTATTPTCARISQTSSTSNQPFLRSTARSTSPSSPISRSSSIRFCSSTASGCNIGRSTRR